MIKHFKWKWNWSGFIKIWERGLERWMSSTCRAPSPAGPAPCRAQRALRAHPWPSSTISWAARPQGQIRRMLSPPCRFKLTAMEVRVWPLSFFPHSFLTGVYWQSDALIREPPCRYSVAENHQKVSALHRNLTDSERKWIFCKKKANIDKVATDLILLPEKHGKASSK